MNGFKVGGGMGAQVIYTKYIVYMYVVVKEKEGQWCKCIIAV